VDSANQLSDFYERTHATEVPAAPRALRHCARDERQYFPSALVNSDDSRGAVETSSLQMPQQSMDRRCPEVEISADCTVDQEDPAEVIGAVKLDFFRLDSLRHPVTLHRIRTRGTPQIISDRKEN
jgi:hypothetical protein